MMVDEVPFRVSASDRRQHSIDAYPNKNSMGSSPTWLFADRQERPDLLLTKVGRSIPRCASEPRRPPRSVPVSSVTVTS
jgi:hypothetical protein